MPGLLKVDFEDANGDRASSSMWVTDFAASADVIVALKAASNAKIIHATYSTPIDISALVANAAVMANVETVAQKAEITYRGPNSLPTAAPWAFVNVGIPAPIGSLINGPGGDLANSDVVDLRNRVASEEGTAMTVVQRIRYRR